MKINQLNYCSLIVSASVYVLLISHHTADAFVVQEEKPSVILSFLKGVLPSASRNDATTFSFPDYDPKTDVCTLDHSMIKSEEDEVSIDVDIVMNTEGDGLVKLHFKDGEFAGLSNVIGWCVDLGRSIAGKNYKFDVFSSLDTTGAIHADAVDNPDKLPALNWLMNEMPTGSVVTIPDCRENHMITDQEYQLATWLIIDDEDRDDVFDSWTGEADICVVDWLVDTAISNTENLGYEPDCYNSSAKIGLLLVVDNEDDEILNQVLIAEIDVRHACNCVPITLSPSASPTASPTKSPTTNPTVAPTSAPTKTPTSLPTGRPTNAPTSSPTGKPTTGSPTGGPTKAPTSLPTGNPTGSPTGKPTKAPTSPPTGNPTKAPSSPPTGNPTKAPTSPPTGNPTGSPTGRPTKEPTSSPTGKPTESPTGKPTKAPTSSPIRNPTGLPTGMPTKAPTKAPTVTASSGPTPVGSESPTLSGQPTRQPTDAPTTSSPTSSPTAGPTKAPTATPATPQPTGPDQDTIAPTPKETSPRTLDPTSQPTTSPPTAAPSKYDANGVKTLKPTESPTKAPTNIPVTPQPTGPDNIAATPQPTGLDTFDPTLQPTDGDTLEPTSEDTFDPTLRSANPVTIAQTLQPTGPDTIAPTLQPTGPGTIAPTLQPTGPDTIAPTLQPTGKNQGANGDPHFKTWSGERYDFHGICDLILLSNPKFNGNLGMDIYIRSKKTKSWSYISTAVIRIGVETFEVSGRKDGDTYWVNGIEGDDKGDDVMWEEGTNIAGYPITFQRIHSTQRQYVIDIGKNDEKIIFKTWKDFVRVDVNNPRDEDFTGSLGLMGSYPDGNNVGRSNPLSSMKNKNEFGQEWQVLFSDPQLFHSVEGPQSPAQCELPSKSALRRRLSKSEISREDAKTSCSHISDIEERDLCIFDVMATNDIAAANAY